MKPKEFISQHIIAVDFEAFFDSNGKRNKPVCMLSISNAYKAVALAEYELAKELLKLHESERVEYLERIVMNYEN